MFLCRRCCGSRVEQHQSGRAGAARRAANAGAGDTGDTGDMGDMGAAVPAGRGPNASTERHCTAERLLLAQNKDKHVTPLPGSSVH